MWWSGWSLRPAERNVDKYCHTNLNTHVTLELRFIFPRLKEGVWLTKQRHSVEADSSSASQETPTSYRIQRFVTAFTTARYFSPCLAKWIRSTPQQLIYWIPGIILLPSLYAEVFQTFSLFRVFPPKHSMRVLSSPCVPSTPPVSPSLITSHTHTHKIFGELCKRPMIVVLT